MPTIQTFPDASRGLVRVEINWADIPSVTQARVDRYNPATGECTPLRPYVCYDGWELELSCGHGIFHDTEAPLDTEFYYLTSSTQAPCLPAEASVSDTFTRVVAGSWGVSTSGQTWSQVVSAGNVPSVNGTVGNVLMDTAGDSTWMYIASPGPDVLAQVQFRTPAIATVDLLNYEMISRYTDQNNYIGLQVLLLTNGTADIRFGRFLGGVGGIIGPTVNIGAYAANVFINVVTEAEGSDFRAMVWLDTSPPPGGWQIETTNSDFFTGPYAAIRFNPGGANTNVPLTMVADNFSLTSLCEPCTPITEDTSANPTTLDSNGTFWIKDPVRPCHDRNVPLCFTQPNLAEAADGTYCIPGSGIFFASMDVESYESNTLTLNPTNAKYPIAMSRQRRGISSVLQLVTRTFADRDALLTLADPGSPLFWQGPANYGIMDQYMDVGTLSVERGLTDHRFQVRVINLPYTQVARPAGPSQGVCGSQVQDYCDFTWAELVAEGFSWDDLIRGRGNPPLADYRTWDDVLAEFTDWNDVDDGTRTWTGLETGL